MVEYLGTPWVLNSTPAKKLVRTGLGTHSSVTYIGEGMMSYTVL
jgi:hypothetical protein